MLEENINKEEQRWLRSIQNKLRKYISSWKWDCILLTSTQYQIVSTIMSVKNVNQLPLLINERIVDDILKQIELKFKKVKQVYNRNDFNF